MRVALPINVKQLQEQITLAENENEFKNRSQLFSHLENTVWAKTSYRKPFTAAVLQLRASQECLEIKTPKGKRGRQAGVSVESVRGKRSDKLKSNPKFKDCVATLRKNNPNCDKAIDKIAGGSLTAAVRLNCLSCCGGDRKEAGRCSVVGCAMYLFNPYLKFKGKDND